MKINASRWRKAREPLLCKISLFSKFIRNIRSESIRELKRGEERKN
jgi:hypothetical protein